MTEEQWLRCTNPEAMLRLLIGGGLLSERKARLFVAAACRRIWEELPDGRSRASVEAAERFADGHASLAELRAAHDEARAACGVRPAWVSPTEPAQVAADASWPAAAGIAAAAAINARYVRATSRGQEWDAGLWAAERQAQSDLLRDLFGPHPFRSPPHLTPARLAGNDGWILGLAQAAYQERILPGGELASARLAVLADALEEAGCTDAEVLAHLRSPGPHVRGCWALDAVLGKE